VLLTLLIGVSLIVVGGPMLKRGWWPRRIGDTPHCRKCDYILSGDQRRCPECGTTLGPRTVVRGERRRRGLLAAIGGALIALGLLGLVQLPLTLAINIHWNHYVPLSWLLPKIDLTDSPQWQEIQRRLDANLLSDIDQEAVVERGLQVQSLGSPNMTEKSVLDYIASRYTAGKLSPGQAERFLAGMLRINLSVRPIVGAQGPIAYRVTQVGRGPRDWWYRLRTLEFLIDDSAIQKGPLTTTTGGGGLVIDGSVLSPGSAGKHRLRVKVEMTSGITGGTYGANWDENAVAAKRVVQDLVADFEVDQGETPIGTVSTPSAAVLGRLLLPRLTFDPGRRMMFFSISASPMPVGVAFNVFVRIKGKEYLVGDFLHNGTRGLCSVSRDGTNYIPGDVPASANLILRSSEAVARTTVGMTQIWKGEIVLPNVPIERSTPSPPAGTQPVPTSRP